MRPTLALLCALLLAAPARAAEPAEAPVRWIWGPGEPARNQTLYFRRELAVRPGLASAWLTGSADDVFRLSVNGKPGANGSGADRPVMADLSPLLAAGTNVLEVMARNYGDRAGVQLEIRLEYADGGVERLVTDRGWSVFTAKPEAGAIAAEAVELAALGQPPWGPVPRVNRPGEATPPARIRLPPGFRAELLYSVPLERQGSWVSLMLDARGRFLAGDQDGKVHQFRAPLQGQRLLEADVHEFALTQITGVQGMATIDGALFMVGRVGEEAGVFRFRDTGGDDNVDAVDRIVPLAQVGHEHGPHNLVVHPGGKRLFLVGGNLAPPPQPVMAHHAARVWAEDSLVPVAPSSNGLFAGVPPPGGWVVSFDLHGKDIRLEAMGLRNAFDLVFNEQRDLFTFDSDLEWDIGMPWYKPTRLLQIVAGGDYGWRAGTAAWGVEQEDTPPSVALVGRGSPTGLAWARQTTFPYPWRDALLMADWTYGRIFAATLREDGAGYAAKVETFLSGEPLPVVKMVANPADGCLYFITGGRRTQSGLYRISYTGAVEPPRPAGASDFVTERNLRRTLESWCRTPSPANLDAIWSCLGHPDRLIRYQARVALEQLPWELWEERARAEPDAARGGAALLALARVREAKPGVGEPLRESLARLTTVRQPAFVARVLLRARQLVELRHPAAGAAFPWPEIPAAGDPEAERMARELRLHAGDASLLPELLAALQPSARQPDAFRAAFLARTLEEGWSPERRRAFAAWITFAEQALSDGAYIGGDHARHFLQVIREDFLRRVPEAERAALTATAAPAAPPAPAPAREFVQAWLPADFLDAEADTRHRRHFDVGHRVFREAGCVRCHVVNGQGGATGPDLSGLGGKLGHREIVREIFQPSAVVPDVHARQVFTLKDGRRLTGRVVAESGGEIHLATDPYQAAATLSFATGDVTARAPSPLSPMPVGLLNTYHREEILDLLAYLRAGGRPEDPAFE